MTNTLTIFDCDGVLVDTEVIVCRIGVSCLTELGIPITADEIAERYVGRSAGSMIADLECRHNRTLSADFQLSMRRRIAANREIASLREQEARRLASGVVRRKDDMNSQ